MRGHRFLQLPWSAAWASGSRATASAGAVADQFRSGAFGLPWNADRKAVIQAKYPGGTWDKGRTRLDRYCAPSRQTLLQAAAAAPDPRTVLPDGAMARWRASRRT
jgi:hypothetical protein